jgi:hypothetical protein
VNAVSKAPASWRSAGCAVKLVVKLVVTLVVKRRPVGVARGYHMHLAHAGTYICAVMLVVKLVVTMVVGN